eukprot:14822746-Heterocapsa_arctica.AAC.1
MRYKRPEGKLLIIGGGIANFTDVAATFTGLKGRTTAGATSGSTTASTPAHPPLRRPSSTPLSGAQQLWALG